MRVRVAKHGETRFASPLFRRLAGRGSFFRGFPFRWALQFVFSLPDLTGRSTLLQERSLVRKRSPSRHLVVPFLHCLVASAKSIHIDAGKQTNDIDLTCYKTLPTKSVTCLQVEPMSLEFLVAPPEGSHQSSLSTSHEDPNDEHPEALFQLTHIYVGGGMLFNHLKYNDVV